MEYFNTEGQGELVSCIWKSGGKGTVPVSNAVEEGTTNNPTENIVNK